MRKWLIRISKKYLQNINDKIDKLYFICLIFWKFLKYFDLWFNNGQQSTAQWYPLRCCKCGS